MDLKVPYVGGKDKKTIYEAAKTMVPTTLEKFGVKADIQTNDPAHELKAKGTGFEAQIKFTDSEAQVSLNLGFLLKPLKGKVLEALEKQLKKIV